MRLKLAVFFVFLTAQAQASYIFRNSASNINTGTLDPARVSPSTFTMYGPIIPGSAVSGISFGSVSGGIASTQIVNGTTLMSAFNNGTPQGNINTINIINALGTFSVSGSTGTLQINNPAVSLAGSTQTLTLEFSGGVFQSTIDVEGLPGMSYDMGLDSGAIVGLWADALKPSTSTITGATIFGYTGINIAISTGGSQVLSPNRFPLVSLGTWTTLNQGGYSGYVTTNVPVNSFTKFGVQITTVPSAGTATQGLKVHLDIWKFGRF